MRTRDQRGAAMIEAPAAIVVILGIGLGAFFIGNLVLRYHQLEEAVATGARFAARASTVPGAGAERRRTAEEIVTYVELAAEPLAGVTVSIRCGADLATLDAQPECTNPEAQPPGRYIQIRASSVVAEDDPVMAVARSVNALFGAIGAGEPFPPSATVTDASVALVE